MGEEPNAVPLVIPEAQTDYIKRKTFDIAYANVSPAQKLDIYLPADGNGPFPVIVAIHGGAFMAGDKHDVQVTPMLKALEHGYSVVSINYRMSGEAIFPALVHDLKAAIRWIRANAKIYPFDPDKIATWGGSAGGYIALMAGVSAGVPELEDLSLGNADQRCDVQAVVAWFPPTDFLRMDEQLAESNMAPNADEAHSGSHSPESLLLGKQITLIPDLVRAANPETYIHADLPPFLIQHGTHDTIVPHQQSVNMAAKLTSALGSEKVTLALLPGAGHGDAQFETDENIRSVIGFLDKHLS